jgi:hypothetical protein
MGRAAILASADCFLTRSGHCFGAAFEIAAIGDGLLVATPVARVATVTSDRQHRGG